MIVAFCRSLTLLLEVLARQPVVWSRDSDQVLVSRCLAPVAIISLMLTWCRCVVVVLRLREQRYGWGPMQSGTPRSQPDHHHTLQFVCHDAESTCGATLFSGGLARETAISSNYGAPAYSFHYDDIRQFLPLDFSRPKKSPLQQPSSFTFFHHQLI